MFEKLLSLHFKCLIKSLSPYHLYSNKYSRRTTNSHYCAHTIQILAKPNKYPLRQIYIYTVQNTLGVKYKQYFTLICLLVLQEPCKGIISASLALEPVTESQNVLVWKEPIRVMNPALKWMAHTGIKPTTLVLTPSWALSTKTICRRKPLKPNPYEVSVGAMSKVVVK